MTYYLVLFPVEAEPKNPITPVKLKVDRATYELVCTDEKPKISCSQGEFLVLKKYPFSMEQENAAYCVAEVGKLKALNQ